MSSETSYIDAFIYNFISYNISYILCELELLLNIWPDISSASIIHIFIVQVAIRISRKKIVYWVWHLMIRFCGVKKPLCGGVSLLMDVGLLDIWFTYVVGCRRCCRVYMRGRWASWSVPQNSISSCMSESHEYSWGQRSTTLMVPEVVNLGTTDDLVSMTPEYL